MKHLLLYIILLSFQPLVVSAQTVVSISIDGTINPVIASFIRDGIEKAENEKAECLLIHLNTPGGLLKSTRVIVSEILESPVPVVVYVSPPGAQSGSAGVFITLAAHIAAMAPGTNIGAAHPVTLQSNMDSTMNEKVTNDAAAFIRSIAAKRNRNMQLAENTVRKSLAFSELEALKDSAIDLIADDDQDLLKLIDGRSVQVNNGQKTLHTKGAGIVNYEMGAIQKMLNIVSDPNIAYLLFMLGMFGILFELYNPGAILPGIVGVISMILAWYAMHTLPLNYAGLALIIFGILLFLLEIKIVSHGVLAIGGVISLLLGSLMLIKTGSSLEMVRISRAVVLSATTVAALFFLFVLGYGIKAQRQKVVTGPEAMIGATGETIDLLGPTGTVLVQGEIWNAVSPAGPVEKGVKVKITAVNQLTLVVEPIHKT